MVLSHRGGPSRSSRSEPWSATGQLRRYERETGHMNFTQLRSRIKLESNRRTLQGYAASQQRQQPRTVDLCIRAAAGPPGRLLAPFPPSHVTSLIVPRPTAIRNTRGHTSREAMTKRKTVFHRPWYAYQKQKPPELRGARAPPDVKIRAMFSTLAGLVSCKVSFFGLPPWSNFPC